MLADVVVHASTEPEAFGRVVIEAQAMGRPVDRRRSSAARPRRSARRDRLAGAAGRRRALAAAIDHALRHAGRHAARAALGAAAARHVACELPHFTSALPMQEADARACTPHELLGMNRILVIRLGALGDFVQSFGPFAAIRAHHPRGADHAC